ncbi:competence protein ComEA [Azotobacter beijerinckii]|uniref:Competence protein ComEA n=1 Tax=Azotobacter beijerinckii TaxID=170623 RepID=A0A1H9J4R7_9GAMM|nr:helix-hairpin-helix domain-containing protein [Azotobacter beijerinckii]SEQ81767.1 competence protein ComEA [Azotobacter beijerinckii]
MRKSPFSSLLFALLASVSIAASAAEPPKAETAKPVATQPVQPVQATQPAQAAAPVKVDLNTADAATLERDLLGIGATKAKAIVDYRQAHGPFASVDELLEVKGIGTATLEKNRARLSAN